MKDSTAAETELGFFFFLNEKQESHQQYNVIKCSTQLLVQGRASLLVALALTLASAFDGPHRRIRSLSNTLQSCLRLGEQLARAPLSRDFGKGKEFVKDTAATPSPILRETAMGFFMSREDSRF